METTTAASPTTALGTPASPKWDPDWLAEVDRVETELGRRICGAHTPAWTPCKLASTHANGRCRFHGGHPGIGAPGGNRNAWVHGLYSRRLQQCGDHCPLWNHCPMAGKDILDLTPRERPHCVYEKTEYDALLLTMSPHTETNSNDSVIARSKATKQSLPGAPTQVNASAPKTENAPSPTPTSISFGSTFSFSKEKVDRAGSSPREPNLIERNVALFQVMLSRAQAALGIARLTDDTSAYTLNSNYRMHSTKVGALVQAQLHIARELRQWLKLLPGFDPNARNKPARTDAPPPEPEQGLPMHMLKVLEETEGFLEHALGLPPGEKCAFSPKLRKRNPPPNPQPA